MDEDGGLSLVEGFEHRFQDGVAQIHAVCVGHDCDAICIQSVKGVLNLPQAPLDIREGQRGPEPKLARASLLEVGGELVAPPREVPPQLDVSWHEVRARRCDAQNRLVNLCLGHHG